MKKKEKLQIESPTAWVIKTSIDPLKKRGGGSSEGGFRPRSAGPIAEHNTMEERGVSGGWDPGKEGGRGGSVHGRSQSGNAGAETGLDAGIRGRLLGRVGKRKPGKKEA